MRGTSCLRSTDAVSLSRHSKIMDGDLLFEHLKSRCVPDLVQHALEVLENKRLHCCRITPDLGGQMSNADTDILGAAGLAVCFRKRAIRLR